MISAISSNKLKICILSIILAACGSGQQSETKVTNGRKTLDQEFPSVVHLLSWAKQGPVDCTGTFVNDSQVVTAAHCVEGLSDNSPLIFCGTEVNGVMQILALAVSIKKQPAYDFQAAAVSDKDLAIVTFPAGTAPAVSALANTSPKDGDIVTFVGYGNNENTIDAAGNKGGSGSGTKRVGSNKVNSVSNGFINLFGIMGHVDGIPEGELASIGPGDSGGPLFINGKLAGVTSGVSFQKTEWGHLSISYHVDLNSTISRTFLDSTLQKSPAPPL